MNKIIYPKEPCPRCGGDKLSITDNATGGRFWFIKCETCGRMSDYGRFSQSEACASWDINARKQRDGQ